jgi:protein Mpv17
MKSATSSLRLLARCPPAGVIGIRVQPSRRLQFPVRLNNTKATAENPRTTPTKSTQTEAASSAPKTIPGPSWLWLEPLATPLRAYGRAHKQRPYLTQFLSSLVIYFFGDLSAQTVARSEDDNVDYDPYRTLRALVIGGISSIPSYRWFIWLSNSFNYSSRWLSLATKVVVNQMLFTPLFNSYFFGMQALLSGDTLAGTWERIKLAVPVSWYNSCKLWPAVTAFSFTFVPIHYRSVFAGES